VSGTTTSGKTDQVNFVINQGNIDLTASSTVAAVYGLINLPNIQGSTADPNITTAVGTYTRLDTNANYSGTITNGRGLEVGTAAVSGGTLTNQFGVYVNAITTGTNNAGVVIGEATGTNQSNLVIGSTTIPAGTFSIYNSSADDNYFAGKLGIGTTGPDSLLHIAGGGICIESSDSGCAAGSGQLVINSSGSGGLLRITDTTSTARDVFTIVDGGAATFQNQTNSATAFAIKNADASQTIFTVDTAARGSGGGNLVKIGDSTGTDTSLTLLQLDATSSVPTSNLSALNGGLFYNSTSNKVQIIENGTVKTLCNTTDNGCGSGGGGGATRRIYLVPEYPGGVLSADGSNNNGTLTSSFDSTNRHNYYDWTNSTGTLNDYDVIVRAQIPSEYASGFGTFKIWAYGNSTSTTNNDIQVSVKDNAGTSCASSTSVLPGSATTWTEQSVTLSGCTFAANDIITITVHLSSKSSNNVRIGEISFQYTN
jgi:hypothetical protein